MHPGALCFTTALLLFHYFDVAYGQACVPSAGSYCPFPLGAAVTCPAGYYCTGNAAQDHVICPAGTSNPLAGQSDATACVACFGTSVATSAGSTACQICPPGSVYANPTTCTPCAAGWYAAAGATACSKCDAGHVSAAGSSACSACRPGSFYGDVGGVACTSCPSGTYTYAADGSGGFSPIWGSTSIAQCLADPGATAQTPLVCFPGTHMVGANCVPCSVGYYCPTISSYPSSPGQIRACPVDTSTPSTGALSVLDCTAAAPLIPFTFAQCAITPGDVSALTSLNVRAVTTTLDTNAVYLATDTAVYRLYLQSNTLELLAGAEGVPGSYANAVGNAARFSTISALAVDLDHSDASVVVVGDGNTVRAIDVYTRKVTLLGSVGAVAGVGGVALRRDPSTGIRLAYVSDMLNHRIEIFSVDTPTQTSVLLVGDIAGKSGYTDAFGSNAHFRVPLGLAFLERSLNASRVLLVADSGNGMIRAVDTVTRVVSTWFKPQDTVSPEMITPTSLAVSPQGSIVYVADTGTGTVSAIQMPYTLDYTVKVLTTLTLEATSTYGSRYVSVLPYGSLVAGASNTAGYNQLLALDGTLHNLDALVQDMLANSADGGGSLAHCHLPCTLAACAPLSAAMLCGNGFLDAGEQCDNPEAGSGCFSPGNCTIKPGYTCPVGQSICLSPCEGHTYAPTGQAHCAADCAAITPPTGYTIDDHCVLTDIDECTMGTDNCDPAHAMCTNTNGSFQCQCFTYFGDGLACADTAYAVYTVVDIPSIASSSIAVSNPITQTLMQGLKNAYANVLINNIPSGMLQSAKFKAADAAQLALMYTSYGLDPVFMNASARLELVTLFETNLLANDLAAVTSVSALTAALSQALFGTSTGVSVLQAPKVRMHSASSFSTPFIQGGWGMNITGVTYQRLCTLQSPIEGWSVPPQGGCWQVEMIFMGGQELVHSDETTLANTAVQQAKNVLYLPRIERDADTLNPIIPAQTLTMSSGTYFPCDISAASASGTGVSFAATACCLRAFAESYRPSSDMAAFLASDHFNAAVPKGTCDAGSINDTFPYSDVVFDLPSEGRTNDLVVGHIDGMPSSEVRLIETIDYTTRTFRVLLVLEEGDLRKHASMTTGMTGGDYSMLFFVGLANFKGTTTSVMDIQNVQQLINVSKSNELTISTFGTNQDPLLTSQSMSLTRIKVSDFFNPVQYLYYLRVSFTMPSNFQSPPNGGAIVPLDSIRLIKATGGQAVSASDPNWVQVCGAAGGGHYVFENVTLQAMVKKAQLQDCVQSDLQMCYPPTHASGVVTFGLPLSIGFLTPDDFAGAAVGNPTTLQVQFMVQSYNNAAKSIVLNTVSMSVQLSQFGYTAVCESITASQTLADVIDGSIYVGMATTDTEWSTTMQQQSAIQVPGSTPSSSLQFSTETLQTSIMTFAALGDPLYFTDARYQGQTVNMYDIWSISFLEPLGGTADGPTPHFDAVKALFFAGNAFTEVVDPQTHAMWLQPTKALLNICPYRPTAGKLACLTKAVSTYAGNNLTRSIKDVVEIRVADSTSIAEMQTLMGQVLLNGGSTTFTQQMGAGFYSEAISQLRLNNRFRKAYVVSPMVDWSLQAMEATQPGKNAYTLASKIIAIGLITIQSASGQQLARRLLSVGLGNEAEAALSEQMMRTSTLMEYDDGNETDTNVPWYVPPPEANRGRRLMQAATSLQPTVTAAGNSLILDLNVPGYDPTTQMCAMLGATLPFCRMIQFTMSVGGSQGLCDAYAQGTLATLLSNGFRGILVGNPLYPSNISEALLADFTVSGCPSASAGGRRLLEATANLTIVVSNVLIDVVGGVTQIDPLWFKYMAYLENATIIHTLLGGQASVDLFKLPDIPPSVKGNGTFLATINLTVHNASVSKLNGGNLTLFDPPPSSDGSVAFVTDNNQNLLTLLSNNNNNNQNAARALHLSAAAALSAGFINTLILVALSLAATSYCYY